MEHGYIMCIRRDYDTGKRYVDTLVDVTKFIQPEFVGKVHAEHAKLRLKGVDHKHLPLLNCLPDMFAIRLRARYNMMDGPVYVRTENPVSWDDWDAFVDALKPDAYQKFLRTYRFK